MPLICVANAQVSISSSAGHTLVRTTAAIPGGAQNKLLIENKPALVEADISNWAISYMTNYDFAAFKAGMLMGKMAKIDKLSVKSLSGKGFVTNETKITLTVSPAVPAMNPNGIPDSGSIPGVNLTISFTDPGQKKFTTD